jgi:hypothetical protein
MANHLVLMRQGLIDSVKSARHQALNSILTELIEVLSDEGFHLHNIIAALSDYCESQPYLDEVARSLDQAANQLAIIREEVR